MRKKYIYFILSLMCAFSLNAQSVTLTPTAVNGSGYSSGPINLGGTPNSTISLGVNVIMSANPGDNGTITIYSSNGVNTNVVSGGSSRPLYFGGGNSAPASFVINLYWTDYATSGQYIYAEYKTFSNVIHKSSNIPIIKNATMTTGTTLNPPADAPDPTKIVNTLCCNQTVRLGEKPQPITGSTYLNPYKGEPYGINSRWTHFDTSSELDNINETLIMDYTKQLGTFTVERSLGYLYGGQFPNNSNKATVTVIPSPLDSNEISLLDTPKDINSYAELTNTNPKQINGSNSVMNLNTLQNPSNVPKRSDTRVNIERYEWEYSLDEGKKSWINIPNENSNNLNSSNIPNLKTDKDNFLSIRRIAIYQNLRISSNTLKIVIRTIRNNNTICCDQKLKIISTEETEKPSMIIGSTAVSSNNTELYYQWQQRPINNRESVSNWSNIPGATSKDYLPSPLEYIINPRGNSIQEYSYRRIAETNYYVGGERSYSNEVVIAPSYERPTLAVTIYPNPATTIIYAENKEDTFSTRNTSLNITDVIGGQVNVNNFSIINQNLISIDISNLAIGTYFLNIRNSINGRSKQLTFIKN